MHHFFAEPGEIGEKEISLTGSDVNHIKNVLRMGVGDEITVSSGQDDCLYHCSIQALEKDRIRAAIESREKARSELAAKIFLFQGLPKSDKMEWIVQKAVELGAAGIIPVETKRTVVKLDAKKEALRRARWNTIAQGAAKQSGRTRLVCVAPKMSFEEALEYGKSMEVKLIPYELAQGMDRTRELLGKIRPGQSVAVFIGPEGGFEEDEVRRAEEAGFSRITLGSRILRTETAGLAVLAMLGFVLEP
ncbi:MAG: 16S rRNA (uracil(1498)-N(3))-methyltransferase [Eubacteriales bacterium]|nr:16S rRNA (uracil(1498)-N(3))-methyltransferase [Eubacteriales bacterium]